MCGEIQKDCKKYFVNYKNYDFNYSERDPIDDPKDIHYTYCLHSPKIQKRYIITLMTILNDILLV
jgi:hypothetical protein